MKSALLLIGLQLSGKSANVADQKRNGSEVGNDVESFASPFPAAGVRRPLE
jgi:hypothetical protein